MEEGETDVTRWVKNRANLAEGLKKWAPEAKKAQSDVIRTGFLILPEHESVEKNKRTGNRILSRKDELIVTGSAS